MSSNRTMEEITRSIRKFILENYLFGYNESELDNDSSLLEMGVLDSTAIMELVVTLENEFDIQVLDSEIVPENLDSIECISSYVNRKLNESAKE